VIQQKNHQKFDAWLYTRAGSYLWAQERQLLAQALSRYCGCSVLQLGGRELIAANQAHVKHFVHAHTYYHPCSFGVQITCSFFKLPFRDDSFDCVICPHIQEMEGQQEVLLQEMRRILRPNGYIICFGLKPFSVWQLQQWYRRGRYFGWLQHSVGYYALTRKLRACDFVIERNQSFAYRPYFYQRKQALKPTLFLESMGPGFFPLLSNAYVLVAWKKVVPLNPLKVSRAVTLLPSGDVL
jgi:SAM-dependent methyltransferase